MTRFGWLATVMICAVLIAVGCGGRSSVANPVTKQEKANLSKSANQRDAGQSSSDSRVIRTQVDDSIHPTALHFFVNGALFEADGQYRHAAEQYKRALQYHPLSHEIRLSFARMLFALREYDNAVEALRVIEPEDDMVQRLRGACFHELGEGDSAAYYYLAAVRLDSINVAPFAYLAAYYQSREVLDSTVWAYRNLTRLRPDDHSLWYELGRLYTLQGELIPAQEAYSQSIELLDDSSNMMAYVRIGELYEARRMKDSSIVMFKKALERDPENIVLNRILGTYYISADSFATALPYTQRVAEAAPMERMAQRRLALVYYVLDSLDIADSILTSLVESGDNDPTNYAYLGRIGVMREDYNKALVNFEAALKVVDTSYDAYLDLGWVYSKLDLIPQEIELYRQGLNRVTDSTGTIRLLMSLGAVLEKDGQTEECISVLERALELAPNDPTCLNFLGYLLADRGERLDYAKKLISRAVEQQPDNAAFLDSYGWVYYRLGKYGDALSYLQKAAELDNDPTILDHLGDAYEANGKEDKARLWWEKALELDPDNEVIKEKLKE